MIAKAEVLWCGVRDGRDEAAPGAAARDGAGAWPRAKHKDKVQQDKGQPLETLIVRFKDYLESEADEEQKTLCGVCVFVINLFNSDALQARSDS